MSKRHYSKRLPQGATREQRFWQKVKDYGNGCWMWQAATCDQGYGLFQSDDGAIRAHRWAYEQMVGEVPEGLQLDHLCRNRACVNPDHLDPVTPKINSRRSSRVSILVQDICDLRHDLNQWGHISAGRRICRVCRACYLREYTQRGRRPGFELADAVAKWEAAVLSTLGTERNPRQKYEFVDQVPLVQQARLDAHIPLAPREQVPA